MLLRITALIPFLLACDGILVLEADGNFVISQITDLHYGEAESLDWGPAQDHNSTRVMRLVLPRVKPGLAMFTGDAITGNNVHANATSYLFELTEVARQIGIPHAYLLGNHDCMPFQSIAYHSHTKETGHRSTASEHDSIPVSMDGKRQHLAASMPTGSVGGSSHQQSLQLAAPATKIGRRELLQYDTTLPGSQSKMGPANVTGASNYVIEVQFDDSRSVWAGSTGRPALLIAVLDTGGGDAPETITQSQVDWMEQELSRIGRVHRTDVNGPIPMLVYFHIPTQEFQRSRNASSREGAPSKCFGFVDDGISPVEPGSADLVGLLAQSKVRFGIVPVAASVGHDHGRDDCCRWEGVWLCFGRHSGYGGYGSWARGLRNIRVRYPSVGAGVRQGGSMVPFPRVDTWVSMEDGTDRDDGLLAAGSSSN